MRRQTFQFPSPKSENPTGPASSSLPVPRTTCNNPTYADRLPFHVQEDPVQILPSLSTRLLHDTHNLAVSPRVSLAPRHQKFEAGCARMPAAPRSMKSKRSARDKSCQIDFPASGGEGAGIPLSLRPSQTEEPERR